MPPFPGIPYEHPPGFCFPLAELCMYILFVLCLVHAVKNSIRDVGYLLGGVLFGLMLEYVNVTSNMGYSYGKFMVMFGTPPFDIPLCIGLGWGTIMYTARIFSDSLALPLWAAVALDALLAISIDLGMDAVAYRLHMWHWNWSGTGLDPLTADWFGVPYGNFFGWLMVVFFYSAFSRLFEKAFLKKKNATAVIISTVPLLAVLLSQLCLYVMLVYVDKVLHDQFGITSLHRFVTFLFILILMVIQGFRKRRPKEGTRPSISWLVPLWFQLFFFAWLFAGGFYRENNWLVVVASLNLLIGVVIHLVRFPKKQTGPVLPQLSI